MPSRSSATVAKSRASGSRSASVDGRTCIAGSSHAAERLSSPLLRTWHGSGRLLAESVTEQKPSCSNAARARALLEQAAHFEALQ